MQGKCIFSQFDLHFNYINITHYLFAKGLVWFFLYVCVLFIFIWCIIIKKIITQQKCFVQKPKCALIWMNWFYSNPIYYLIWINLIILDFWQCSKKFSLCNNNLTILKLVCDLALEPLVPSFTKLFRLKPDLLPELLGACWHMVRFCKVVTVSFKGLLAALSSSCQIFCSEYQKYQIT